MAEPHHTQPEPDGHEPGAPPGWDAAFGSWARADGAADEPPPAGAGPGVPQLDLEALLALLEALRRSAPVELGDRVNALIREALLTVRALIDWYLERLDDAPPREPRVERIPID